MRIPEIMRQLTHEQMSKLTEKALARGPFKVDNIRKIGNQTEVTVCWPDLKLRKTYVL